MILAQLFLSMVCNFGFLLMAMDRLRNEVADLALMDDLTGVGNRRQLLQRLTEECARSDPAATGRSRCRLTISTASWPSSIPMAMPRATPACGISP